MDLCPCGSGRTYAQCCEPYHKGTHDAPTAEALMRARYSAYAKGEIDYIERTHERDDRDQVSIEETKKWSQESTWQGLKIVRTDKGRANDKTGVVEFVATYTTHGLKEDYHEVAEFKNVEGRWFYDKGTVVPTQIVREQPKVGRNDPCPCGSGKKYKLCHGR